jgi:hypothetical protein
LIGHTDTNPLSSFVCECSDCELCAYCYFLCVSYESYAVGTGCCGADAVNAIVGGHVVSRKTLRKSQAHIGLPDWVYVARGSYILALLAILNGHGFHRNTNSSHRGKVGFCDSAVDGTVAYLLNSAGQHWIVLKTTEGGKWVLCDSGKEKVISDPSSYITEFVGHSKDHWAVPFIQGGRGEHQPYGAGPLLFGFGKEAEQVILWKIVILGSLDICV